MTLCLIILLPLLGFLINGLGRKALPKNAVAIIGSASVLIPFIISAIIFSRIDELTALANVSGGFGPYVIHYFNFISVGDLKIPFAFQIDQLSTLFLLIITGVGFLIHVYSAAYMHGEKREHFGRYFSYLNLFIFSMLLLVMGANYVIMFIGWEGVGLCSYLLIGYWFKNIDFTKAAKKAFVMNRIGDLGFLRQKCADPFIYLVARCNGRSHTGFCPHTCRHHGNGGYLHDSPKQCTIPTCRCYQQYRIHHWCGHCIAGGYHCYEAK